LHQNTNLPLSITTCGNSLIGIRTLEQLNKAPKRKKDSKKTGAHQQVIFDYGVYSGSIDVAAKDVASISRMDEDDTAAQKVVLDEAMVALAALRPLADLYTAYLMDPNINDLEYRELFEHFDQSKLIKGVLNDKLLAKVELVDSYSTRHHYFHWPLEFPDIFGPDAVGGFSAAVGNPPWDIVKPNSQEFFSDYDPKFRSYGKQEANRVSKSLMAENHSVSVRWQQYCDSFAEQSNYYKEPSSYNALGKGDINTFKLFLERFFNILNNHGRMGIIVPSGIYTDQGCQALRELFFEQSCIEFLYCFENRWPTVFSAVDGRFKFVLFGTQKGGTTDLFKCAFMEHDPEKLPDIDKDALKMDVEQVKRFSPETLSVMEFKSQRDVDVTTKIYADWPLLGEKLTNTWNVKFNSEFHMTSDSHLFKTQPTDCPLYEGKMFWFFDSHFESPRYWLAPNEAYKALCDNAWETNHCRVGFRNVASSTNERTLICGVMPPAFHGNSFFTVTPWNENWNGPNDLEMLWAAAVMSSFCIDFIIRQKVTTNLNYFYLESLPVPRSYENLTNIKTIIAKITRLFCYCNDFGKLWTHLYEAEWQSPDFWYPLSTPIDTYGPAHEQEIRKRLRDEATTLTPEWEPHCGVHDRLPDRRDTGDRAQLRAEIDAYVANLYGLSRDDFSYILDTFPVLKKKEEKAFGEFMSKRKCLEEYDRLKPLME